MVRSFIWPMVERQADAPSAPVLAPMPDQDETERAVPALPEPTGFVAMLAPELSRLFGYRIGLKPLTEADTAKAQVALAEVGRLQIAATATSAAGNLLLAADRISLSRLLDRMFGSRPEADENIDTLAGLPPQSGSWLSLARLMGEALARAVQAGQAAGSPIVGAFTPHGRVAPPADHPSDGLWASDRLLFRLDTGEQEGLLSLRRVRKPVPLSPGLSPTPEPGTEMANPIDLPHWRSRTRELALGLDMPVTLKLGELRMPLARVAALRPGDIVPLARPRALSVMVAGQKLASLPAALLEDPDSATEFQEQPR